MGSPGESVLIRNLLLYTVTVLIWGSTWLGIKFQLGQVDPLASVVYRFCLATVLLFTWCGLRGLSLRFTIRDHLFIALQGICLFAVNYWLFYLAEVHLTSGIVAVVFSTIVFWNILNGRLFLKTPVRANVICGTGLGIVGIGLVFWPELSDFSLADSGLRGFLLSMAATLLFPIIALIISTLFEGYHWSPPAVAGVVIILMGNALALSAFELRSMRLRWPVRSRRQPHQDVNLS